MRELLQPPRVTPPYPGRHACSPPTTHRLAAKNPRAVLSTTFPLPFHCLSTAFHRLSLAFSLTFGGRAQPPSRAEGGDPDQPDGHMARGDGERTAPNFHCLSLRFHRVAVPSSGALFYHTARGDAFRVAEGDREGHQGRRRPARPHTQPLPTRAGRPSARLGPAGCGGSAARTAHVLLLRGLLAMELFQPAAPFRCRFAAFPWPSTAFSPPFRCLPLPFHRLPSACDCAAVFGFARAAAVSQTAPPRAHRRAGRPSGPSSGASPPPSGPALIYIFERSILLNLYPKSYPGRAVRPCFSFSQCRPPPVHRPFTHRLSTPAASHCLATGAALLRSAVAALSR